MSYSAGISPAFCEVKTVFMLVPRGVQLIRMDNVKRWRAAKVGAQISANQVRNFDNEKRAGSVHD
jgi:hypothetical protein